jgi:hypothetical protein
MPVHQLLLEVAVFAGGGMRELESFLVVLVGWFSIAAKAQRALARPLRG